MTRFIDTFPIVIEDDVHEFSVVIDSVHIASIRVHLDRVSIEELVGAVRSAVAEFTTSPDAGLEITKVHDGVEGFWAEFFVSGTGVLARHGFLSLPAGASSPGLFRRFCRWAQDTRDRS